MWLDNTKQNLTLINEPRSTSYAIMIGVWAIIATWTVLHDQYVVRIEPEHFTVYHDPRLGLKDPYRLALAYGFGASIGPGLLLGFACATVGRVGDKYPKIRISTLLISVVAIVILTESTSALLGLYVHRTGNLVFPYQMYPDLNRPMLVTQTIQLSCYFGGAILSAIFLFSVIVFRARLRSSNRFKKNGD